MLEPKYKIDNYTSNQSTKFDMPVEPAGLVKKNNFGQMQMDAENTIQDLKYKQNNLAEPLEEKGLSGGQVSALGEAALTFGMGIKNSIDMDAEGTQQENANVMNMAMQGAQFGGTVGSVVPGVGTLIGTAGGALIGAGIGYASKASDRRKFTKKKNLADQKFRSESIEAREEQSRIADGEARMGKLKALYKANIGLT